MTGPADFAQAITRAHAASTRTLVEAAPADPMELPTHIPAPVAGALMVAQATSDDLVRKARMSQDVDPVPDAWVRCQACFSPGPRARDHKRGTWNLCDDCSDLYDSPFWPKGKER